MIPSIQGFFAFLQINFQRHRTVVGAGDVRQDIRLSDPVLNAVGDQKIVDAPARVLGSGLEAVGPPGVENFFGVQMPEAVRKSGCQKFGDSPIVSAGTKPSETICTAWTKKSPLSSAAI